MNSWKWILTQLTIVAGLIVLSCAIAPLIVGHVSYPLDRVLSRVIMAFILMGVVILLAKYRPKHWIQWGWQRKDHRLELFLAGFLITMIILTAFSGIQAGFGAKRLVAENLHQLARKIPVYVFGAFAVGILEEFLFRGILFGVLKERISTARALFWTSFVYAAVHFLRTNDSMNVMNPTIMDSFKVLGTLFQLFAQPELIWQSFLGLFILGLVLNHLYLKTNSLFLPIGLHAGAVFFLKLKKFFVIDGSEQNLWWWGTSRFYDGLAGWVVMGVLWVGVLWYLKKRKLFLS